MSGSEDLDSKDVIELDKLDKKASGKHAVYTMGAYRLLEEVNNGILFFGKVGTRNKKETAEFICHCGESFRSVLSLIANGKTKNCGCEKPYKK